MNTDTITCTITLPKGEPSRVYLFCFFRGVATTIADNAMKQAFQSIADSIGKTLPIPLLQELSANSDSYIESHRRGAERIGLQFADQILHLPPDDLEQPNKPN